MTVKRYVPKIILTPFLSKWISKNNEFVKNSSSIQIVNIVVFYVKLIHRLIHVIFIDKYSLKYMKNIDMVTCNPYFVVAILSVFFVTSAYVLINFFQWSWCLKVHCAILIQFCLRTLFKVITNMDISYIIRSSRTDLE